MRPHLVRTAIPAGLLVASASAVLYSIPSTSAAISPVARPVAPSAKGKLLAREEFKGSRLDKKKWGIYNGPGHDGKGKRSPSAIKLTQGHLRITGTKNGTTGGLAWLPGARKTGRWEARVRMSRACACYHPVLLLWPTAQDAAGKGEVDFMEVLDTGKRTQAEFFLHYGSLSQDFTKHASKKADLTKWHTFAVVWTSSGMSGYIDGKRWFNTGDRRALPPGRMGAAIQLDWFPQDRGRTARGINRDKAATMEVDWIRMYTR